MFSKYLDQLRSQGKRSFTFEQILHDLGTSVNSIKSGIYRLKNEGKLITPAKGLYLIIPPEHRPYGSIPAEELVPILMKHLKAEYYTALLSAASFYGATHQKPARFQVITNKLIKHPLEFGQVKLEIIYKKQISGLPVQDFTVATGYLKVSSPELVAFDLLSYPARSGGLNHISTVIYELTPALDFDKLIELAEQNGKKSWLQRLGFILEKVGSMDDDQSLQLIYSLKNYLNQNPMPYIPLASELQKKGHTYIKQWKIIENTDIESDL